MNRDPFVIKLAEILQADPAAVTEDFALTDNNWDSVAHLATIAWVDEHYGITAPARELAACTSVGCLLALLKRELESKASEPVSVDRGLA